jgi:hypothetical protein
MILISNVNADNVTVVSKFTKRYARWVLCLTACLIFPLLASPVLPGQTIAVAPEAVKAFRPTYRLLSYCLVSNGFPVSNELAGIDRPDLVNALFHEIYSWAGLTPPR